MPTEKCILGPSDFGEFEPELEQAFREGFRFSWHADRRSEEEQALWKRFSPAIQAAHRKPDTEPEKAISLMRECYELSLKLCAYLSPNDLRRGELSKIVGHICRVGDKVVGLLDERRRRHPPENLQRTPSRSMEVLSQWTHFEDSIRTAEDTFWPGSVRDELERFRIIALRAGEQLAQIRAELDGLVLRRANEIVTKERAKELKKVSGALFEVQAEIAAFAGRCAPPSGGEARFHPYFERLLEAFPVQASDERGAIRVSEVPESALYLARSFDDRRAAILQWLCVQYREFHPLLPGASRRDHLAPATAGGRGQRNTALRALAAALVLLELVEVEVDAVPQKGKVLFDLTVKRVREWISEQAETGFFFVDTTARSSVDAPRRRTGSGTFLELRYPLNLPL